MKQRIVACPTCSTEILVGYLQFHVYCAKCNTFFLEEEKARNYWQAFSSKVMTFEEFKRLHLKEKC